MVAEAFQPNSRTKIVRTDKQGVNNSVTRASTINCIGVNTAARFVPTKATNMITVNSFLTTEATKITPTIAGRPNQKTVNGAKKLFIGVRKPKANKA